MPFQKGHKINNGKKFSAEHRKKMSEVAKSTNRVPPSRKGKKRSLETNQKLSGENHWNWNGGISKNLYPPEFNRELKQKIRKRDNYICCLCGRTEREELEELNIVLAVNHIDFDKNNCREENLNTLCVRCNVKINRNREYWTQYFKME